MPRVSLSSDYLLQPSVYSPNEVDAILSRKLYSQFRTTDGSERGENPEAHYSSRTVTLNFVDPELALLIERFFDLAYLNTVPMVNLLATAVASNFLKENIRELDKNLQEDQAPRGIQRGTSLLYKVDHDTDDDDLSWVSAPT